jgi:type I restriction enzyme S subunit
MNRHGWTYKKLGDVTTKISDGSHNPPKGIDYSEYPMLSSKNVFFDCFNYDSPRYLSKEEFDLENKRTDISDGDILLTIVGTVGRTCCVKNPFIPFVLQRSVAVLKPKRSIIESRFLMYALHSLSDFWNIEAKGVAQKGIYLKQLATVPIPVPPLAEQKRIVAELDLLSGIIDKKKEQLKAYDQLAQSIFYTMFGDPIDNPKGWETKYMNELFDIGSSKRVFESQWQNEGIPFYRAREIVKFAKNEPIDSPIFVSEELYSEYAGKYGVPSKGDIMVTAVGTLGVCYIVKAEDRFYFKDGNILWFKSKGLCESRFIKDQYATPFVMDQIQGNANAAVVGTYTITNAKKTKVIVPPLQLQKDYVQEVEAIEQQKALVQQSIDETQTMFDYTMDKYFG